MKVKDFISMFISGEMARERFKSWFEEHEKAVNLNTEVPEEWFKSKLLDFCIANPSCFSKVRT